jgi:hypothetical protein
MLLADCDAGIAVEEFWKGRLRSACRFFDESLEYAEKTLYPTERIEAQARVFFRYMQRISTTLYSDVLDEEKEIHLKVETAFSKYLAALEALDEERDSDAMAFLESAEEESFFANHIRIRLWMENRKFAEAKELLLDMLKSEAPLNEISLYTVLCELEICCRETDDFKGAYNYANDKVLLLEQMLKDV